MRSKIREESAMDRPDPEYPDPDGDHTLSARRSHLAKHLDKIRKGKAKPRQKLLTRKDTKDDNYEDHNRPRRSGPGSDFDSWDDRTHAEFTGDTKADIMNSRGVEADNYRADAEKAIRGRERQALRSRRRSQRQQASTELVRGARLALAEMVLISLEEVSRLTVSNKAKSAAKQAKLAAKGQRLMKRGGKVKGITISKEAMRHLTDRKPGQGSTPMRPADVVRQVKLAANKHKKGQVAVDAEHGRTTGTALVRKRSEIPDKDVVKTSTVMKKDAGQDVPVTNVQTNQPESAYKTTKGFSAAGPKDPRFMNNVPKRGRARKKFLSGKTLYTAAPGESAPRVGDWGKSGHVTITPKKESIQTARRALGERVLESLYDDNDLHENFLRALRRGGRALRRGGLAAALTAGTLGGGDFNTPKPTTPTSKYRISSLEDRQAAIAKEKQAAKDREEAAIRNLPPPKVVFRGDTGEGNLRRGTQPEDMGGTTGGSGGNRARNIKKSLKYQFMKDRFSAPILRNFNLGTGSYSRKV